MSTMHVVLMGPQGSGKGTQSERVRARLNLGSVATGELFRSAIKRGTALGQEIQSVYDRGELVPDDITIALVNERLDHLLLNQSGKGRVEGALYDGFPRTIAQAEALDRALEVRGVELTAVIAIDVPRETLVERLAGRRVCSVCGRVYNIEFDPPAHDGLCNSCGGTVIQRADDTPDAVAKRLDLYDLETAPVVDQYSARGFVLRIDGDRSIDEVTESIVSAIQARKTNATAGGR